MPPSPHPGDKSPTVPGVVLELLLVPRLDPTGDQRLVREHPCERHEVALPQTSALEAPQQDEGAVYQQLGEVVRARHVPEPARRGNGVLGRL